VRRQDRGEVVDAQRRERREITVKIPAVRRERVDREPPLDGQVVEIDAYGTAQSRRRFATVTGSRRLAGQSAAPFVAGPPAAVSSGRRRG
jgi:hypothetical protein